MPDPVISSLRAVLSGLLLLTLTSCTLDNRINFHAPNTLNPVLLGPVDRIGGKLPQVNDYDMETMNEDVLVNGSIVHKTMLTSKNMSEDETTTIIDDISKVNLNIVSKTKNNKNKNVNLMKIDISYYSAYFVLGLIEDNILEYTGFVSDANNGSNK